MVDRNGNAVVVGDDYAVVGPVRKVSGGKAVVVPGMERPVHVAEADLARVDDYALRTFVEQRMSLGLAAALGLYTTKNPTTVQQMATCTLGTGLARSFWGNGASANQPVATANMTLEIVSSSASDTSAGSGARTILITGVDDAFAAVSETVTMNGTAAVSLANQYMRINTAEVATAGTSQINAGTITIRISGAGATQNVIMGSQGSLNQFFYTVPASRIAVVTSLSFGSMGDSDETAPPLESTSLLGFVGYTGASAAALVYKQRHRLMAYRGQTSSRDFSGSGLVLPAKACYAPSVQNLTANNAELVGDLVILELDV
jgi:hypothetical protein